jgi:hypothetical protein
MIPSYAVNRWRAGLLNQIPHHSRSLFLRRPSASSYPLLQNLLASTFPCLRPVESKTVVSISQHPFSMTARGPAPEVDYASVTHHQRRASVNVSAPQIPSTKPCPIPEACSGDVTYTRCAMPPNQGAYLPVSAPRPAMEVVLHVSAAVRLQQLIQAKINKGSAVTTPGLLPHAIVVRTGKPRHTQFVGTGGWWGQGMWAGWSLPGTGWLADWSRYGALPRHGTEQE